MKLLQKYLLENGTFINKSDKSEATYWDMYGLKWRVASHASVRPSKYQILYQKDSNMTALIYNGNVKITSSFRELERYLESVKIVNELTEINGQPIIKIEISEEVKVEKKEIKPESTTDTSLDNSISSTLVDIIKKTNYKCLKLSSIEESVLKYYNVK